MKQSPEKLHKSRLVNIALTINLLNLEIIIFNRYLIFLQNNF